jgi:hypothetical protein
MNAPIRPGSRPSPVPDPDARNDAEAADLDEGKPGADENAAGFLKNVIHTPSET